MACASALDFGGCSSCGFCYFCWVFISKKCFLGGHLKATQPLIVVHSNNLTGARWRLAFSLLEKEKWPQVAPGETSKIVYSTSESFFSPNRWNILILVLLMSVLKGINLLFMHPPPFKKQIIVEGECCSWNSLEHQLKIWILIK